MRISDLARIAIRNIHARWAALPLIGFAIAAFCLCFSGTLWTSLSAEQAMPYAICVVAGENSTVSDDQLNTIRVIPGIRSATPLLQVPVTLKTGDYSAAITLSGVHTAYLRDETFKKGGVFSDEGAMPYIVLNEAACKLFSKGSRLAGDDDIDWLGASFKLQSTQVGRLFEAKVCGIVSGGRDTQTPAAYVSLSSMQLLLSNSTQSTGTKTALARIENAGYLDGVSEQIDKLGLTVTDPGADTRAAWADMCEEAIYLAAIGAVCLLFTSALLSAQIKNIAFEEKDALAALHWAGMKQRRVMVLFRLRALFIASLGTVLGIIAAFVVPLFFSAPPENIDFLSAHIPALVVFADAIVCVFCGTMPMCIGMRSQQLAG
jgi:ABC-type lipoprotein release transport system permease subunit